MREIFCIRVKWLDREENASINPENKDVILITCHDEKILVGLFPIFVTLYLILLINIRNIYSFFKFIQSKYKNHVNKNLGDIPNVRLIEPLDYLSFVYILSKSKIVLTDSGGIQEEAPSFGKPVLVMRDTTERAEGIEAGTARLVGTQTSEIIKSASELIDNNILYLEMSKIDNPYGTGDASEIILDILGSVKFDTIPEKNK